jgi:hypothetical protein
MVADPENISKLMKYCNGFKDSNQLAFLKRGEYNESSPEGSTGIRRPQKENR